MTIARGIKTPIIKTGDDLVEIVTSSVFSDMKKNDYQINDNDIIGITEAVVSIAKGNYATLDDIKVDINSKFKGDDLGIVYPILSRNRFSVMLRAFARSKKNIFILLSYPFDEVGNPIMDKKILKGLDINPYYDILDEDLYYKYFKDFVHPWTKVNMVNYYKDVCKEENANVKIIFSNNATDILKYTKNVLISNIHSRFDTKELFVNSDSTVYALDEIMNKSINGSGYNEKYGLLGTNVATKEKVKLFPNEDKKLLIDIQNKIKEKTNKHVEVFVYGDGAFKDPVSTVWELADPVVSPFYTEGLNGSPNEIKLKYLVEDKFKELKGEELEEVVKKYIETKNENLDLSLGTTPRRFVDLLGSLCDLVTGSGDKGTPVVLIQNYFKKIK